MIVPLIIGGITGLLFSDSKKYSNGGGVGEPYDSMTKYQLEKELQKLTDEWFEIRRSYSTDNHPRQVEIDKEKDKIITLLYGENFSGKNQKFKYKDGGNLPEKYQIKKGEKYYSKDLSTGNTKWVNSPDMGYTLTKDEATSIKSILSKEFDNIEIVKYDPEWWKYQSGGDISTSVRNKKGEIVYLIEPADSIIYEFGGDVKPVSEKKAREMAKKGIYSEIEVSFIPNFQWIGKGDKITNSRDSFDFFKNLFDTDKVNYREEFIILLLNRNNAILGYSNVNVGSDTASIVDKKSVLGIAAKSRASAIILCHNHPSGNRQPSNADIGLTKDLKQALELINVSLIDHIIITRKNVDDYQYTSFADEGLM